eukprot:361390-Chlamydomonas_euryale.AAC.2
MLAGKKGAPPSSQRLILPGPPTAVGPPQLLEPTDSLARARLPPTRIRQARTGSHPNRRRCAATTRPPSSADGHCQAGTRKNV